MRLRKEMEDMQEDEVLITAQVSDALAHPARIRIFRYIYRCNRSLTKVCNKDVVEAFPYSQATVSQHIKKLTSSGLVQVKKEDKFSYYYINLGVLAKYMDAVKRFDE